MARLDKTFVEVRATVKSDTAIAGVFGDDTNPNLACVALDANGELVLAGEGAALGVIDTTEGKADSSVPGFLSAAAGSVVTVFKVAQFVEVTDAGLTAGDPIYSAAAGDVATSPPASVQKIGDVMKESTRIMFDFSAPA
jgi:hypothetical protein